MSIKNTRPAGSVHGDHYYDEHESCRRELQRIIQLAAERPNLKGVYRRRVDADGRYHHEKLNVLQIDWFEDGLRVVVE